ncbi:MAG: response regulator [Verrucomicrobiota bacterium]
MSEHLDPIRVMLIEDSAEYRGVIRLALKEQADIELISEFASAEVALRHLDGRKPTVIPEVILLDIRLAGMNGLRLSLGSAKRSQPQRSSC